MKLVLALALMLTSSTFVFAEETNQEANPQVYSGAYTDSAVRTESPLAHGRRIFLGCMDEEHECEHAAHDRGYRNHGLRYDDYRCHHDHHYNGCYAWR